MPDFFPAYTRTAVFEGGYANDPSDPGAETYKGISRRWWPSWGGWRTVDAEKATLGAALSPAALTATLSKIPALQDAVVEFYRAHFWDAVRGDHLVTQGIAEEVYDSAVNLSVSDASMLLQRTLNVMNNRGTRWPDLRVDGSIREATLTALAAAVQRGFAEKIVKQLNHLQGALYQARAEKNPTLERFFLGWLERT